MKIKNIIASCVVLFLLFAGAWSVYKSVFTTAPTIFFKTQKPEKRDIYKIVHAEGSLEAQGTSRIGSLISAKVKKIYVDEGDKVVKGALLADLINDRGGDTGVRQTAAQLKKAQSTLATVHANYKREKALFKAGQLSREAFEKAKEGYVNAQADVASAQACYDKELFLFEQTQVHAPHDGTVIGVAIKEGQTFSPSAASETLFEIAQDLSRMKVTLYIDENKMGDVKVGMETKISVDAYPYKKPWKGKIESLGLSRAAQQSNQSQSAVCYEAKILIDNADGLLRPGMTVHAKITIAKAKQVLTVPGFVFQLNSKVLESAAKMMRYDFKPLDHAKKKELVKEQAQHPVKMLWIKDGKALVEKSVTIGVTDNAYFQVLSGLQESDDIVTDDMTASDEIKRLAKQTASS